MSVEQRAHSPRAAFVFHPEKTNLALLQARALFFESSAGWARSLFIPTTETDTGARQTREAIEAGCSVVVAVGGDGTVREVAETLRDTGVSMGIVPQGSGNVLCRNLGIPLTNLDDQLKGIFSGTNRLIDVGIVNITRADGKVTEHAFLVLAGMGLDARTIKYTKKELKKRFGWLAYVDAGVRTMLKDSPLRIHYRIDGGTEKNSTVYSVMFGNCGILPGGLLLIPDAKPDDGMLDVISMKPVGPLSWLRIWSILGWENGVLRKSKAGRKVIDLVRDTRYVNYRRVHRLSLRVDESEPIQLDGDDFGTAVALDCEVDEHGLAVRVLPEWSHAVN